MIGFVAVSPSDGPVWNLSICGVGCHKSALGCWTRITLFHDGSNLHALPQIICCHEEVHHTAGNNPGIKDRPTLADQLKTQDLRKVLDALSEYEIFVGSLVDHFGTTKWFMPTMSRCCISSGWSAIYAVCQCDSTADVCQPHITGLTPDRSVPNTNKTQYLVFRKLLGPRALCASAFPYCRSMTCGLLSRTRGLRTRREHCNVHRLCLSTMPIFPREESWKQDSCQLLAGRFMELLRIQ